MKVFSTFRDDTHNNVRLVKFLKESPRISIKLESINLQKFPREFVLCSFKLIRFLMFSYNSFKARSSGNVSCSNVSLLCDSSSHWRRWRLFSISRLTTCKRLWLSCSHLRDLVSENNRKGSFWIWLWCKNLWKRKRRQFITQSIV